MASIRGREAALGVVAHDGLGPPAKDLRQHTHARGRRCRTSVEGLRIGKERGPLGLRSLVGPGMVVQRSKHHEHRAARADHLPDGIDHRIGPAFDLAHGSQGCMRHHQSTDLEPGATEIGRYAVRGVNVRQHPSENATRRAWARAGR